MKIEFKSHYWLATPKLREIKIKIDDEVIISKFLSQDEIWELANQLIYQHAFLTDVANEIED